VRGYKAVLNQWQRTITIAALEAVEDFIRPVRGMRRDIGALRDRRHCADRHLRSTACRKCGASGEKRDAAKHTVFTY
jgi:hypothetical protein